MGIRRPALSPSLHRDRAQREAVTSSGSLSRAWLSRPQQRVPPLKPPACLQFPGILPPALPCPLPKISTQCLFLSGEDSTPKPGAPPQVSPSSNRLGSFWKISWGLQAGRREVTQGQVGGNSGVGGRLWVQVGVVLCK